MNKKKSSSNLDKVKFIKIYGLQRSGTNYVTHLLNTNFKNTKVLVNVGGWKHGHYAIPYIFPEEIDSAIVFKNPYAWLWSVYEYWGPNKKLNIGPNLEGVSFEQFVKSRATYEVQKGVPYLIRAANAVQYWNNMNYHWLTIMPQKSRVCHITYESVLASMHKTLLQLMEVYGLDPVSENLDFKGSNYTFTPSGENLKENKESKFSKQSYYTQSKYLEHYTPELIDFVNQNLDQEVMQRLGYRMETI